MLFLFFWVAFIATNVFAATCYLENTTQTSICRYSFDIAIMLRDDVSDDKAMTSNANCTEIESKFLSERTEFHITQLVMTKFGVKKLDKPLFGSNPKTTSTPTPMPPFSAITTPPTTTKKPSTALPTVSPQKYVTTTSPSTNRPNNIPTNRPTNRPTIYPTNIPAIRPTNRPTIHLTNRPTSRSSIQPTSRPSIQPTIHPTSRPTNRPSIQPTSRLINQPTNRPSIQPTSRLINQPTNRPTNRPTARPTVILTKNLSSDGLDFPPIITNVPTSLTTDPFQPLRRNLRFVQNPNVDDMDMNNDLRRRLGTMFMWGGSSSWTCRSCKSDQRDFAIPDICEQPFIPMLYNGRCPRSFEYDMSESITDLMRKEIKVYLEKANTKTSGCLTKRDLSFFFIEETS